jgi:hypothetical protein
LKKRNAPHPRGGESVAGTMREISVYFDGPHVYRGSARSRRLFRPLQPPERGAALFSRYAPAIASPPEAMIELQDLQN